MSTRSPLRLIALPFILTGWLCGAAPDPWTDATTGLPAVEIIAAKNISNDKDVIFQVTEDALGRLLVSSDKLHVFDGQSWQAVDIPNAAGLLSTTTNETGVTWIGGFSQLGYVTESTLGNFQFHSLLPKLPATADPLGGVWGCARLGQLTYFICRDQLLRWDGTTFQVTKFETDFRLFPVQLDGEWWFHHVESGLYLLTEDGPVLKVPASDLPQRGAMGLIRDNRGLLIIHDWGYFRPGQPDQPVSPPSLNQQFRELRITSFKVLPKGYHALGTINGGVMITDPTWHHPKTWGTESGLPERTVFALGPISNDRLLAATPHALFHFPANGNPSYFGPENGLAGNINALTEWQGKIWVTTTEGGFQQMLGDNNAPAIFKRVEQLAEQYYTLAADGQDLLLGKHGGADAFDGQRLRNVYSLNANLAYRFTPSQRQQGLIYSTEFKSIARLQRQPDGSFLRETLIDNVEASLWIHEDTTDRLWLGTLTTGAFIYETKTKTLTTINDPDRDKPFQEKVEVYGTKQGIALLTNGRVFLTGSDGNGIHRVSNIPTFDPVDAAPVPGTDDLLVIFELPNPASDINRGLGVLSFDDEGGTRWKVLDLPAIAKIESINTVLFTEEAERKILWVGGAKGLLRYDFDSLSELEPPPLPLLRLANLAPTRTLTADDLTFPFKDHKIGIRIFTGDLLSSQRWQFQTRLITNDGAWSAPDPRRAFDFTNLSEGDYRFEVRTITPEGLISQPASLALHILPPWYRSGWAYGGYGLVLMVVGFGFIRIREQRIRRRNQELEQLVKLRTEELVKASAAKDEFLAGISHEIRNPMNGVIGIAETFPTEGLDRDSRHKFGLLRQCATHLSSLLEDILDFSKVEAGAVELEAVSFDLPELMDSLAAITEADSKRCGIPVDIAISPAVPRALIGDPRRIRQILINFVSNALKFSDHGAVSVTVWCKGAPAGQTEVVFAVSDDGPGIPPEEQKKLFTRFERGAAARRDLIPGTGLGLALCRGLAQKMGGRVWLESEPGQGSCFYFSAPFALATPGQEAAHPGASVATTHTQTALVVDDEEYNRIALTALLETLGCTVHSAGDGPQTLALASLQAFDFVFLDYDLPGMNGLEIARGIRALTGGSAGAFIIATTAFNTAAKRQQCLTAGMNAFLGKPVTMERLRKALAAATGDQRPSPAADPAPPGDPLVHLRRLAEKKHVPLSTELTLFLAELAREAKALDLAMRQEVAVEAGHYAHQLCGRCSFINERALVRMFRQLEQATALGQWAEARAIHEQITTRLAELRVRLSSVAPAVPPASAR